MKSLLRITLVLALAFLLVVMFVMVAAASLPQASILVNSTADDLIPGNGECTLREAIMNANGDIDTTAGDCLAGSGADQVELPAGTYTLTIPGSDEDSNASGDLDILDADGLTIQGAGADLTVINGNQLDRVLHLKGVYGVEDNPVNLNDLTVANGYSTAGVIQGGGGILNDGADITLNDAVVRDNISQGDGDMVNGGGLLSINGQALLVNTVVRQNRLLSELNFPGGGIFSSSSVGSSSLDLIGSQVLSNTAPSGGGISASPSSGSVLTFTLSNSTVSGNAADGSAGGISGGGGLFIWSVSETDKAVVNIMASTIRENQALGNDAFTAEGGGALLIGSQVLVDRSLIISNTASGSSDFSGFGGGMFFLDSTTTVVNSTFSGNNVLGSPTAFSGIGGGIVLGGQSRASDTTILNTTVANNTSNISEAGLAAGSMGPATTLSFVNTIIAKNQAPLNVNCGELFSSPTWVSLGHNLEDNDSCHFDQPSDQIHTDPMLGPLLDNGGPTWTHALLEGSPAVDTADDTACAAPPVNGVDQRGVTRPQGAACDIGAFEQEFVEPISDLAASNDSPTILGDPTILTATVASGTEVSYAWDFGDGMTGTGESVSHTYPASGTFTAVVTATNPVSQMAAATVVTIAEPVAGLTAINDGPTILGDPTILTATVESGTEVSYAWDFGDGTTGAGQVVSHIYSASGEYTATVTAANPVSEASATTTVVVIETPAPGWQVYLPVLTKP